MKEARIADKIAESGRKPSSMQNIYHTQITHSIAILSLRPTTGPVAGCEARKKVVRKKKDPTEKKS